MKITGELRPDLTELPPRIRALPVDGRGYPVPFFVSWIAQPDGTEVADHRVSDGRKWKRCVDERLCWICGQKLGGWLTFLVGPMCALNRVSSEPPAHRDCATWSAKNCPFLSKPQATRRPDDLPEGYELPGGVAVMRNPGVMLLWVTRSYQVINTKGKPLIIFDKAEDVEWFTEGRAATRAEVEASITDAMPIVTAEAQRVGQFAVDELGRRYEVVRQLLPAAALGGSHAV